MNWLRFLENKLTGTDQVMVFTRKAPDEMETFQVHSPRIRIIRSLPGAGRTALSRYNSYMRFYLSTIHRLAAFRPDTVLYYESLSAIPALVYKYFLQRKSRLMAHYHEYTSPAEYKNGMIINSRAHRMEKRLFPFFFGISHTNAARMELFTKDNAGKNLPPQSIWPNYPPESWQNQNRKPDAGAPVRFVYVGALDIDTMYVTAFADWVIAQKGRATWDIYSWNCTPVTKRFLERLPGDSIRFHQGVSYDTLPEILSGFQVGVILYRGHIPNYIYNAPNKLFEYWSCGLDVWFPVQLTGALPYVTTGTWPRIVAVDFDDLDHWSLSETLRSGLIYKPSSYSSEPEAEKFFNRMMQR